jgi:hypothetical protein
MTNETATLLKKNLYEVFGERDPARRQAAIAAIWKEDGIFVDPSGAYVGQVALNDVVARLLEQFPEFVFTELGTAETFHGIGRLAWGFGLPNEAPKVTGLDVVVVRDGRLSALYTFLDTPGE